MARKLLRFLLRGVGRRSSNNPPRHLSRDTDEQLLHVSSFGTLTFDKGEAIEGDCELIRCELGKNLGQFLAFTYFLV